MPRRWPRPHGHERVERAHAEREPLVDPAAAQRVGRRRGVERQLGRPRAAARRRSGVPSPSRTRPSSSSPTRDAERAPGRRHEVARRRSRASRRAASAACGRRGSRRPRPGPARALRPGLDRAELADLGRAGPVASMTRPIRFVTRPCAARRSASWSAAKRRSSAAQPRCIAACPPRGERRLAQESPRRARELLVDARVDLALDGADDAAAAGDAALAARPRAGDCRSVDRQSRPGRARRRRG